MHATNNISSAEISIYMLSTPLWLARRSRRYVQWSHAHPLPAHTRMLTYRDTRSFQASENTDESDFN